METLLGIIGLVVIVAIVYGVQAMLGRGVGLVEGAITGNSRTRGLTAVHTKLDFNAPVEGKVIVDRLLETLDLGSQSGVSKGLKLAGISEDGGSIAIESGNKFVTHLRYVVDTDPTDAGCAGFAAVLNWVESNGNITTTDVIERLHKHVQSAVEHVGGTVTASATT